MITCRGERRPNHSYFSRWCVAQYRDRASDSYSRLRWLTLRVSFSNPAVAFDRGAFTVHEHRKQIAALVGLAPYDFQEIRSPASPAAARALRAATRRRAAEQRDELAPLHSITSSASASSLSGIVRPSAFAVLRLSTSSTLVGCSIGRPAGLATPFNILST